MTTLLVLAILVFAAITVLTPHILTAFLTRRQLRRPPTALILVFRIWFGLLALATFWLLLHQPAPFNEALPRHP